MWIILTLTPSWTTFSGGLQHIGDEESIVEEEDCSEKNGRIVMDTPTAEINSREQEAMMYT